jgi:hypothetical protein
MPKVPRLNQLCTISTVTRNARGSKTSTVIATDVPCRFTTGSGQVLNGQGEYIEYDGYLHMGINPRVNKGMYINLGTKIYKVLFAIPTVSLKGVEFMQYLELKEHA